VVTQTIAQSGISWAFSQHPVLAGYAAGALAMVTALAAIAAARPRTFAFVLERAEHLSMADRRWLLAGTVVAWSLAWPVTLPVIGVVTLAKRTTFQIWFLRLVARAADLQRRR